MWEDTKAGKKWVTINQCYFARDFPHAVGRPCSLESNEVNNICFRLPMQLRLTLFLSKKKKNKFNFIHGSKEERVDELGA